MKRIFSMILIAAGIILISFSISQIYHTKSEQNNNLAKANLLIKKPTITKEEFSPFNGDVVGILSIPTIGEDLPIVEGTEAEDLDKGVGHYSGSAWPLDNDQIVLSGHRDTVFRRMGELTLGDELIIKVPYGEFTYKIEATKVVEANDLSIIKSTAPDEVLILTTCYPFRYVGNAPQRYIITAKPIK